MMDKEQQEQDAPAPAPAPAPPTQAQPQQQLPAASTSEPVSEPASAAAAAAAAPAASVPAAAAPPLPAPSKSPVARPPSIDQQLAAAAATTSAASPGSKAAGASSTTAAASTNPITAAFLGRVGAGAGASQQQQQQQRSSYPASGSSNNPGLVSRTGSANDGRSPSGSASPYGASTPTGNGNGNGSSSGQSISNNSRIVGASMAAGIPRPPGAGHSSPFHRFQYPMPGRSPSTATAAGASGTSQMQGQGKDASSGSKPVAGNAGGASAASPGLLPAARDPNTPNPVTERLLSHSPGTAIGASGSRETSRTGGLASSLGPGFADKQSSSSGQSQSQSQPAWRALLDRPPSGSGNATSASAAAASAAAANAAEQAKKRRTSSTSAAVSPFASSFSNMYPGRSPGGPNSGSLGAADRSGGPHGQNRAVTASPSAPTAGASAGAGQQQQQRSPNPPHRSAATSFTMTMAERQAQREREREAAASGTAARSASGTNNSNQTQTQQQHRQSPYQSYGGAGGYGSQHQQNRGTPTSASPPPHHSNGPPGSPQRKSASTAFPFLFGGAGAGAGRTMANPGGGGGSSGEASRTSGSLSGSGSHHHQQGHSTSASASAAAASPSAHAPPHAQNGGHYRRVSMGSSTAPRPGSETTSSGSGAAGAEAGGRPQYQPGLFRPPAQQHQSNAGGAHSRTASLTASLGGAGAGANASAQRPGQQPQQQGVSSRTGGSAAPLAGAGSATQPPPPPPNASAEHWKAYAQYAKQPRTGETYAERRAREHAAAHAGLSYASASGEAARAAVAAGAEQDRKASISPALQKKEPSPLQQQHQQQQSTPASGADKKQPSSADGVSAAERDAQQAGNKRKRSDVSEAPVSATQAQAQTQTVRSQQQQQHPQHQGVPHPQQQQQSTGQPAQPANAQQQQQQMVTLQTHRGTTGPLFSLDDIKGAALRPPLMAVRSDLVVRALHKIASQQAAASNNPYSAPVPPFLGRVVYDPFLDPAELLDADLLKNGVGGKVEIWLDTEWLQGEVWEAGAPSHPATSLPPSPDPAQEDDEPIGDGGLGEQSHSGEGTMMDVAGQSRPAHAPSRRADEDAQPSWTLWDLPPLRNRKIWGTDVYTDDSDILAACIHSGWLRLGSTAPLFGMPQAESTHKRKRRRKALKHRSLKITIVVAPKLIKYEGSLRAGVRSRSWGNGHDGVSYAIESVELVENAAHRMPHSRLKQSAAQSLLTAKERCACSAGCDATHRPPAYNRSIALGKALLKVA